MRTPLNLALLALVSSAAADGSPAVPAPVPLVQPNPNLGRAGVLRDRVLTLTLNATIGELHIDGVRGPAIRSEVFAEPGRSPTMPGPLVRVPQGTELRLSIRNSLHVPLTFIVPTAIHGGRDALRSGDSIVVPVGEVRTLTSTASVPGNYFYFGITPNGASRNTLVTGALAGALIVDSARAPARPRDRVFMIMATLDSAFTAFEDTSRLSIIEAPVAAGRLLFTINGRSWPNTERVAATAGDSLRWRVINASFDVHPMHLHGFYFRIDDFSGPLADVQGRPSSGQLAVTQLLVPFSAMTISWSPDRPGNWLFHCHFALHLDPDSVSAAAEDPQMRGMIGLVLGVNVAPRSGIALAGEPRPTRHLRLVAIADSAGPGRPGALPSMRFVLTEKGRVVDTHTDFSPEIDLTRGEPVSITIVNHLAEPTSVHWHGIEVEDSYVDGVPGFSGAGTHLAPAIAPGDSFEAHFTPPRSGTFMYHAHADEVREQTAGLEGAIVVRDRNVAASADDHVFFFKGSLDPAHPLEINGQANPDTIVLHVGRLARFRIINLSTDNPVPTVTLTARPDSTLSGHGDTMLVRWTPVAKDGAALPVAARVARPARQLVSMGETYDFEFVPHSTGHLKLEVRPTAAADIVTGLLIRVPIRIE